jgi:hypothetical protein
LVPWWFKLLDLRQMAARTVINTMRILLLFLVLPLVAQAQFSHSYEEPRLGVGASIGSILTWQESYPLFAGPLFEIARADMFGFGSVAALSGSYRLGGRISLRGEIGYLHEQMTFAVSTIVQAETEFPGDDPPRPPITGPTPVDIDVTYDRDLLRLSLVGVGDLARVDRAALSLLLGPSFALEMANRRVETVEIDPSSPNSRFVNRQGLPTENNGRRLIIFDSETGGEPSRLGMIIGAQFRIRSWETLSILSALEYELPLTFITDPQADGSSHSYQLKVGAEWHFE